LVNTIKKRFILAAQGSTFPDLFPAGPQIEKNGLKNVSRGEASAQIRHGVAKGGRGEGTSCAFVVDFLSGFPF